MVQCAGKCKKSFRLRELNAVSLYFEPGKKGGEKTTVYFCLSCFVSTKARVRSASDIQRSSLSIAEGRRARMNNGE